MALKGASVAYAVVGGLILLSGIKGAKLSSTVTAVLHGDLTLSNEEPIIFGSTATASTTGAADGSAILADAEKYNGHKYVFGGASNPNTGWDCSSFVSYVLGHDMSLPIPGGSWNTVTNNGASHGPVASAYLSWSGATTVPASQIQPGDLLCWQTHVGFAVDASHMFSAYDTAQGTLQTPWAGPTGEGSGTVRRINSVSTGGGGGSSAQFALALLNALGAPTTAANESSINSWISHEGTAAKNNPLATTQKEPGSTSFNSVGVQNYPNINSGITATVTTLNNGRYGDILMMLKAGRGLKSGASAGLSTWSGGGYSSV
jgi:hypothetical protein